MKPSFFSLFKRGRYLSAWEDQDDSKAATKPREERERFAVAALAFCLRHDEGFRRHFWERICRVPSDPAQMPPITADDVAIEPQAWADLALRSEIATQDYQWVVEAKAGASLQPKQNPASPEFLEPGGYGALLAANKPTKRTRLRYIVLGAEHLGLPDRHLCGEIFVQERSWGQLLDGITRKGIVGDLIESFAALRIREFYMEEAKKIVVTGGIQNAINALTVLDAICEHLGIRGGRKDFRSFRFEDGSGFFGYYIKQPQENASNEYLKLQKATQTTEWCIAFLGYEHSAAGKSDKAVWFFLNSKIRRNGLQKKMLNSGFEAKPDSDEEFEYCVHVTAPLAPSGPDFGWFQSVIDWATKQ